MSRLFLDANIPTYAAGREHPLKGPCKEILRLASEYPGTFFTDAEVLQEMLHRYLSLRRWPEGARVIMDFATVMRDSVETVRVGDVLLATELVDRLLGTDSPKARALGEGFRFPARDLLHVAVMMRKGASRIVSADKDFDELGDQGIERLNPADIEIWRPKITNQEGGA